MKQESEVAIGDPLEACRRLTAVMQAPDRKTLEALLHPDCLWGHSDGRLQSRGDYADALITGRSAFHVIETSDEVVSRFGDVAVVDQTFAAEGSSAGKPVRPRLRTTLVWKLDGGDWRLIARRAAQK